MDGNGAVKSHTETFSIPGNLIGLARGKKDSNLKSIESLRGIKNAYFKPKDSTFTITGYNEEIVKIGRSLLEYGERDVCIPRSLGDFLQQNNNERIREIVHDSGLVRAEIHDDDTDKPPEKRSDYLKLLLVGTMYSIDEAKSSIKTLVASEQFSEFQSKKEDERKKPHAKLTLQFKVASHLVGLAIGKKGANVVNVRKLQGIVKVEQHDDGEGFAVFNIYSNSHESMMKARQMLEIIEDRLYVPPSRAGLVIGSGGVTIKDIKQKTQVLQIDVKEGELNDEGLIPVVIIGYRDYIEAAKLCIQTKIMWSK